MHRSLGLHRVAGEAGVLPQAAWRLDPAPELAPDEVRIRVERLNLDAASYRQLHQEHGGDGAAIRDAVLKIITERGKMHNPVTGSGGMLTGIVEEAGPQSRLGLKPGDRVATLVSLTLTPLRVHDGLAGWDGLSEQVPCDGQAIIFGRSIAAVLPGDLPVPLSLSVMDVCGAPALTKRVVASHRAGHQLAAPASPQSGDADGPSAPSSVADGSPAPFGAPSSAADGSPGPFGAPSSAADDPLATGSRGPVVAVIGAGGKSGSLSAAAARDAGAGRVIGIVPTESEAALLHQVNDAPYLKEGAGSHSQLNGTALLDDVVIADARDPLALADAVAQAGGPADVTVVCVDVPGCEGGAILATRQGGTIIFFSMATSFSAAALGAEGVAADVTMLIGNGYVPGHAQYALELLRANPAVRALFERRIEQ